MGFRINTNINAIDTQRNLMETSTNMSTTMRRLSSGLRINSAADDAAGLAISQKLNAQVTGLNQAVKNSQDGISLVQTAEGALNETQSILQRMRQLAVQSANDTNTSTDRTAIQSEMNQLSTEISRISNTTSFNTKNLLAGGFKNQSFQIGANSGETMSLGISAMDSASLHVAANGATISATQNTANLSTIANVSGGFQNNVNYTVKSTAVTAGSLTDANGVSAKGITQGQNIGNESLNTEGSFAGTAATNYTFRVSGVDPTGTKVNQVQFSTDGGSTWATSQGQLQKDGTYAFQAATNSATPTTDSGLTFGFSLPSTGAINAAVGDQFTFAANPAQTAASIVTLANTAANQTLSANAAGLVSTATGAGSYLGSLSGAFSIVLNTTTVAATSAVVTGATINIGGTSIAATAGATPAAGVGASYTAGGAANPGLATVNFMGMSFNFSLAAGAAAASGAGTVTYSLGNLTPVSASTSSKINGADPGSYSTAVNTLTGLVAAGASASTTTAGVTANITGAYTGTSGNLQIRAAAGNWTTAPTASLITNNVAGTAQTLTNYSFTAATTTAQSKMSFTLNGASVNIYNLSAAPTIGDEVNVSLENASGTPGGNIAMTAATNTGASTNTTASQNVGNESLNTAGNFVGTTSTNYLLKANSVNGTQVTGAKFSTDGGSTWATATATAQSDGSYHFQAQQSSSGGTNGSGGDSGMTFSFTTPANGIAPQVGDQFALQAVAASTYSAAAATVTNLNGVGTAPTGVSVSGTYSGPYSGAVNIVTTMAAGAVSTATVKVGSTTLDASQVQLNATNNTVAFQGLTYTFTGQAGNNISGITGQTLTGASQAQSANLVGNAAVTTGNLAGLTAPTVTATATQIGAGIAGLGSGAILLNLKDFNTGGTASNSGINSVAWEATGSSTATGFSASSVASATTNTSADFSYNSTSGHDVYTAGTAYGGSLAVTGADGNVYKIVVSNSTNAGATVSIQNSAQTATYATYNVKTSGQTAGDVVALNLTQANVTSAATQNIGAETSAISGTYTGATNLQYTAKVSQVDTNGNVSQIQLSTDGGSTYGTAIAANAPYSNPAGNGTVTNFNLSNGLTMSMTPGQFNQNKAVVGDNFTFTATATSANGGTGADLLQLQNTDAISGSTLNVGTSQLLQNNQTTATVGAANLTLTAAFGAMGTTGGVSAGSTTVTSQASQAAVIGANGQVVTNASAYAGLDVTTQTGAQSAISTIDAAINTVSLQRAQLGAIQNRLQHTINNLSVGSENLNAAQSRIMDVDVAAETVNMTKNQILEQAGISILAQANQQPQMVLKLLG